MSRAFTTTRFLPFWPDHLNFLRLEIALTRRAAHDKAASANGRVAAVLGAQIPREGALLMAELANHASWLNAEHGTQHVSLSRAEADVLADAQFLARLAVLRGSEDIARRYETFAAFKARQQH